MSEEKQVEHSTEKRPQTEQPPVKKRRRWLRWLLILFAGFIVLLCAVLAGLRMYYNDEMIRQEIEREISRTIDGTFKISELDISILNGQIALSGVSYSAENTPRDMHALKLKKVQLKIDIIQSISSWNLTAQANIDGLVVNILRYPKPNAKKDDKQQFTTNIHDLLHNLTNLPWKIWLSRVNWYAAEGRVIIKNSSIHLSDAAHLLQPCSFSGITAGISRINNEAKFNASFACSSPQKKDGHFDLNAQVHVARKINSEKPLAFLSELAIKGNINGLDAAYISRYYGLGKEKIWLPGGPLEGKINITAPQMSQLQGDIRLQTSNLATLFEKGKPITGTVPISAKLALNGDLSGQWTVLKQLTLDVTWGGRSPALKMHFSAHGSLEKSLTLSAQTEVDTTIIGHSPVGILLGLQNSSRGKARINFLAGWDRNSPWKLKVEAQSKDLIFITPENQEIPADIQATAEGTVTHTTPFTAQSGSLSFNVKGDNLALVTAKPIVLDFARLRDATGTIEIKADTGGLYNRLQRILRKWNIGKVDELVSGSISRVADGGIEWALMMKQKGNTPDPIELRGGFTQKSTGEMSMRLHATCKEEGFHSTITATGQPDKRIDFEQQISTRISGLHSILRRLVTPLLGKQMPTGDYRGVFRQSGKGVYQKTAKGFDLSVALAAALEDADFPFIDTRWKEKNGNLAFSGYYRKTPKKDILRINNLKLRSQAANINANTAEVPLHFLFHDWREFLRRLPVINIAGSLGSDGFARIASLCPQPAKGLLSQGKSLRLLVSSEKASSVVKLGTFELRSSGLNATVDGLRCSPANIIDAVEAARYPDILKSIRDFTITASSNGAFFQTLKLPPAWTLDGVTNLNAAYSAKTERLKVNRLNFLQNPGNKAILQELALSGNVNHASLLLDPKSTPQQYISTISEGVNVKRLRISVTELKQSLNTENQANLRALSGKILSLNNARFSPLSGNDYSLSGELQGAVDYYSKAAKWPLLSIDGTILFPKSSPLKVRLAKGGVSSAGTLNLSRAKVEFNAMLPYKYRKPNGHRCELAYTFAHYNSGLIKVPHARLKGGPLQVALNGLEFQPGKGKDFSLRLQRGHIGAPLNTNISNLLFDKTSDTLKGSISTTGINFNQLSKNLVFDFPLRLSGGLGPSTFSFDGSYYRIMGGGRPVRPPNNAIKLGPLNLALVSTTPQSKAELAFGIGGAKTIPGKSTIILQQVSIKKPYGYNYEYPVQIKEVQITPDMSTLFSDRLVLNEIRIDDLEAVYEMAFGTSNIGMLQKYADELFPKSDDSSSSQARKTFIKDFYFTGGVVKLSQTLLMGKLSFPVPLPPFHTSDIGGNNTGSVFRSAFTLVFSLIGKTGVGLVKNIGGTVGNVGKNVRKTILRPLDKLFGGDRDNADSNRNTNQ